MMTVSLGAANINAIKISYIYLGYGNILPVIGPNPTCRNWQIFLKFQSCSYTNICEPVTSFTIKDDEEDPSLIWTILPHPWTYIGTIHMIFAVCIGIYCFTRFWIWPATPRY